MTDNEIIKAYEEEIQKPQNFCVGTFWNTLDLINRLMKENNRQKAKIKRLQNKVEELSEVLSDTIRIRYAEAKAEARKEVIEKLNKEMGWWEEPDGYYTRFISDGEFADIVSKMESGTE